MKRSDQLRERWERWDQERKQAAGGPAAKRPAESTAAGKGWPAEGTAKKWACGMCPSCFQRDACPGGSDGLRCPNYLAPEPTRAEWPQIYREALEAARNPKGVQDEVRKIGRVNALRDALHRIHGFTAEEIKRIENERTTEF